MKVDIFNSPFKNKKIIQCKGTNAEEISKTLSQSAKNLTITQKHEIRQQILSSQIMKQTKSISCDLSVRHYHIDYEFQSKFDAFYLKTCKVYHNWHASYIAKQISAKGELHCPQCKTSCEYVSDIVPDAFVMSIWDKARNYPGSKIIFQRQNVNADTTKGFNEEEITKDQTKTLLHISNNKTQLVEIEIWQFVKDQKLTNIDIQKLANLIKQAKNEDAQLYQKEKLKSASPILINLICFYSWVRIRNPLVHKHCSPSTHNNKLILFSFEHVFHQLFFSQSKDDKICCPYKKCSNFFDTTNFKEVGLVLPKVHKRMYEEEECNMYGQWFSGNYSKNWFYKLSEDRIFEDVKDELKNNVKQRAEELVKTVTLQEGRKRVNKLHKKIKIQNQKQNQEKNSKIKVSLGQFNLCPVRCHKCSTLNSINIFQLGLMYSKQTQKQCPVCKYEAKNKLFYDLFYIDVQMMQFLFLYGKDREQIYFDLENGSYVLSQNEKNEQKTQEEQKQSHSSSNEAPKTDLFQRQQQKQSLVSSRFRNLAKNYPNQFNKLSQKSTKKDIENPQQINFSKVQTNGNLLLYKYAVPQIQSSINPQQLEQLLTRQ